MKGGLWFIVEWMVYGFLSDCLWAYTTTMNGSQCGSVWITSYLPEVMVMPSARGQRNRPCPCSEPYLSSCYLSVFFFFFLSSLSHLVSLHSHPGLLISLLQGPSLTDTFVDICLRWLQVQTPKHRARILSNSFCLCGCCPYLSRCWGLMPTALGQFFMWCSCLWMPGMVPSCAAVLVGLC